MPANATADPRYKEFVQVLDSRWKLQNDSLPFSFSPADGKQLKVLLKNNPKLTREQFEKCVTHRAFSEGVSHSAPIHRYVCCILDYWEGKKDRFGKVVTARL